MQKRKAMSHAWLKMIFIYIFRIFCVILFLYQAYKIGEEYVQEKTGTQISQTSQEMFPKPQFCISVPMLDYSHDILDEKDLISFDEYENGKWLPKNSKESAEQFFDRINPNFSDIVSEIQIEFQEESQGDKYYNKVLKNVSATELRKVGVSLVRCDYYWYLKCYCINLQQVRCQVSYIT